MKKYLFILSFVAAALVFTSCSKPPQAEMDAANAALEQAKAAQADLYLQADFLAVQDSLNAALVAIEAQKSKMFGSYGELKEKLVTISAQATELVGKTATRKEEIKGEIAAAQAEVTRLTEENTKMVEMAPKGKEGKEAIEAIKIDLAGIGVSAAEVPALVESGDLLGAQTKINAARQKATDINNELKTVLEKYQKK